MSTDPFGHDDAAYVLGALGPGQRRAFEEHLAACDDCARSIQELAGLPGLLAGLPASSFADPDDAPPPPDTLLPQLLREVRRRRRRTVLLVVAGAAAALVVALGLGAALRGGDARPAPIAAPVQQMAQVDQDVLTAGVSLEPVAWGTRMHLACRYADGWEMPEGASYALVVHTRDGASEQVATWKAVAGRTTRLDAATDADVDEITRVDVLVTGTDRRVLTLRTPTT